MTADVTVGAVGGNDETDGLISVDSFSTSTISNFAREPNRERTIRNKTEHSIEYYCLINHTIWIFGTIPYL